ncbi:short-chain fatty acid transporter [Piscirickettsia litoralis]|uniref:Short-chain fatty acid transporter n=2 Tax=Piscirickettsia litoralis TaxID=1891921 RepID=A0ABX3A350_9GAMM|nr:short-chain fatty acid transporter [Piscirickettsia litoralis]
MPDSFVFAAILTLLALVLGVLIEHQSVATMLNFWGDSFWSLLAFGMQMVLILATGYALAESKYVNRALLLIKYIKTPGQGIIFTTFISSIACWLNWGFGLVVGALIAREVSKKVKEANFALLVASAYTGFLVWHAGLSGSIPLIIATHTTGLLSGLTQGKVIPLTETIFSYENYIPVLILIGTLPILNWLMNLKSTDNKINKAATEEDAPSQLRVSEVRTPAEKLENSRILSTLIVLMFAGYIINYFLSGKSININMVNMLFMGLGLLAYGRLIDYVDALKRSILVCSGVVLQFPFYAGIMGMLTHSGLAASISNLFVHISTAKTFPLLTFYSSALTNIFVPSGGGHWVIQGPYIMPAAHALGVAPAKAAMAIAWGEAWANMIQPFWAIPLLAIAGLKIRDIMGYCVVALIWSGIVLSLCIYFL